MFQKAALSTHNVAPTLGRPSSRAQSCTQSHASESTSSPLAQCLPKDEGLAGNDMVSPCRRVHFTDSAVDNVPLICDYGSGFSKVGFAGSETPIAVFPTILGKLRHDNPLVGMQEEDWFIGEEVWKKHRKINLHYPISRGAITNWDNLEKIWHYSFYKILHVAPEQHPLLLTEPPLNKTAVKQRTSQVLFETFHVPALYLANGGVLSLYAAGATSGTAIESGEGMTYFVPVIDGCPLHQSTTQLDVAGQDLTVYLLKLLTDSGNVLVGIDREYIRELKEKYCYVALDFNMEMEKTQFPSFQKKFKLPDGKEVTMDQEIFKCPEGLFKTDLMGRSTLGIHMAALQSITSCERILWKTLFSNITLSGGTGACSGLRFRLQREITKLVSPELTVKVFTCPYSKYSAWVGASILCSLSTFKDMWVTRSEYQDIGSSIIIRRSF